MEDRATCRISSQHIANWIHHNLCSEEQVEETMKKMALVVDQQNAGDPEYIAMGPDFNGISFSAALDLAYVASGRYDGFWEFGLKPWDVAAGALLIQEAGGIVQNIIPGTDPVESGSLVCATPKVFDSMQEIIKRYDERLKAFA